MKLSPLSPVYRALQRATGLTVTTIVIAQTDVAAFLGGPLVVYGLGGLAIATVLGYEVSYYRRFSYRLTDDTLDIQSGVFGLREREIPYHRIQNVDISENFIQRILGIASVGLETAGGSSTEGSIRFVSSSQARSLQKEIQRRKRPDRRHCDSTVEPTTPLFVLAPRELALIGILSFDLRVLGLLSLVGPGSIPFLLTDIELPVSLIGILGLIAVVLLLGAAWLLGIAVAVVNFYGYRLTRVGDELRYERGLFHRYTGSIPAEKIQSITIEDNPLKRAFGYASLKVETAGYSPGRGSTKSSLVAVPIARRARVENVATAIEPAGPVEFDHPPSRVRRRYAARYSLGIVGLLIIAFGGVRYFDIGVPWYAGAALGIAIPPAAHLKWRHRGIWIGPDHVVTRNGFWNRSTKVVPYYRIQTVIDRRTLFQRRWRLATLSIDTAGSLSITGRGAAAVDIDERAAERIRVVLIDRLQESLSRSPLHPSVNHWPEFGASQSG